MSHWRDTCPLDCKVYVGDLGSGSAKHELERAFSHYGPLRNVWVARNPPGFAFVEFDDARDASDAVRALDGRMICGRRCRVELSSGKTRRGRSGRPAAPRRGHNDDRDRDRDYDKSRRSRSRSPAHRRKPRRSRSRSPRSPLSPHSPRSPRSRSRSGSRGRRSSDRKRSFSRESKSHEKSLSPAPEAEGSRNGDGSPEREVSAEED